MDCSPLIKTLWYVWFLVPLAGLLVLQVLNRGQTIELLPSGSAGHMVKVSPTSGEATSARFLVRQEWWNDACARAGNKPVKGKLYKGGANLRFARFD